jgi:hypothetical protein
MQDGELVLEQVVTNAVGREHQPVGVVFVLVPPRSEPDLDPTVTHVVDLGDDGWERADGPERGRCDECA